MTNPNISTTIDERIEDEHNYVSADRDTADNNDGIQVYNIQRTSRRLIRQQIANSDHDYLGTSDEIVLNVEENFSIGNQRAQQLSIDGTENSSSGVYHGNSSEFLSMGNENIISINQEEPSTSLATGSIGSDENITRETRTLTTTRPKKRRRQSLNSPKINTPKAKSTAIVEDSDIDEDDGLTCPICFDIWEMTGIHRLVSLRCGHLFGDSCIRRWLAECVQQTGIKTCPQCKSKAAIKDIRHLYAKKIRAVDRSEEHSLRNSLEEERHRVQTLQNEICSLKLSYTIISTKLNTLETENERLKQLVRNCNSFDLEQIGDTQLPRLRTYKLFMERNVEVSREPGCRVLCHADQLSHIIVSQKSSQNLFTGYGIRFIDTDSYRPNSFIHTSSKIVRDVSLSANQQLMAVTSQESRSKLFDLRSRQIISVFSPSVPNRTVWACTMGRYERENCLYLGDQNGTTLAFDVRVPMNIVEEYKTEEDLSPVINIASVPPSNIFPGGGLLVCKLQSLWFYEFIGETFVGGRLNIDGPFLSMNFDVGQETLLIAARSSSRFPQSRFVLGKLVKIDDVTMFNVKVSFFGSKASPVMARCTQIAVEQDNTLIAGYIQDMKLLALFDAGRELRLQSIPVQDIVYDTCPLYMKNATYLAALTETKCRIYKLTSSNHL